MVRPFVSFDQYSNNSLVILSWLSRSVHFYWQVRINPYNSAFNELVGDASVFTDCRPPGTGSEDFSYMSEVVPGCYLIVGNDRPNPLHNPDYEFNDDALTYGASFFARIVETKLAPDEG